MRLAPSSTAFHRALTSGGLTQLELLDLCAGPLGADGVVLDVVHFPRRDLDYLAQLKKLAADLGLSVVAVRDDELARDGKSPALEIAALLGAPYVLTRMPQSGTDPVSVYNEALRILGWAVADAKRRNVTIAVRNVRGSLADDAFELGRVRKEADSAWLRFALDAAALESGQGVDEKVRKRVVLAYRELRDVPPDGRDPHAGEIVAALHDFPGFLTLDYAGSEREQAAMTRLVHGWRKALAESELKERVAEPHVPS
ncbi:MAG: sugar phosphate isomerase/epimerase [Candidatus Eremiobacteraeota bacterium]|nr:sugar phosphate isomerase/epimerase [Candidatus Eremiobacteraeota bacterium]